MYRVVVLNKFIHLTHLLHWVLYTVNTQQMVVIFIRNVAIFVGIMPTTFCLLPLFLENTMLKDFPDITD